MEEVHSFPGVKNRIRAMLERLNSDQGALPINLQTTVYTEVHARKRVFLEVCAQRY